MKLHDNAVKIERVGVETENSFTIKTTAKAFDILSSGLYTDSITAIIRELSCNAYDSHVLANKESVPFCIHLPNTIEPFLSIRDYGVGLSDHDVLHLYTTYFDSTKTHSNEFIGALGLGSKSPFSYSKSYDVISRFDGLCRSYHMFINEHGIPDVVKMATTKTTDCNGLEVKIGIDPSDFRQVMSKTASTLKHFIVKPTIVGALHFDFDPTPTTKISGKRWTAFNSASSYYPTKFTAVQGNVQYKVNVDQLGDELTHSERNLFSYVHAVGYFDIGDLEVAANREEIRYDPQTKRTLATFIKSMLDGLATEVIAKCKQYDSFWDACMELSQLSSELFGTRHALQNIIKAGELDHPMLDKFIKECGKVHVCRRLKNHTVYTYDVGARYGNSKPYARSRTPEYFEPFNKAIVLFNDVKSGGIGRLVGYAENNPKVRSIIVIKEHPHTFSDDEKLKFPNYADYPQVEYDSIIKELGDPQVRKLSEACPPIAANKKIRTLKAFAYHSTTWYGYNKRVVWNKFDIDVEKGGIFFVLKNGSQMVADYGDNERIVGWNAEYVSANISHLVTLINGTITNGTEYKRADVVGVSVTTWKKIKNNPKWIDAFGVVDKHLPKINKHIRAIGAADASLGCYGIMAGIKHQEIRDVIMTLPTTSPFRQVVDVAISEWSDMVNSRSYYKFCAIMHTSLCGRVDFDPYFTYNDFNNYPLFSVIETLPTTVDEYQAVVEYITLMDENNTK